MLLYWRALEKAITDNYRVFDFGRSTRESGTYRFKLQWGGVTRQLHWHYWLERGEEIPYLTPTNAKFRLAVKAWQLLPLPLANFLGPKIVKSIP